MWVERPHRGTNSTKRKPFCYDILRWIYLIKIIQRLYSGENRLTEKALHPTALMLSDGALWDHLMFSRNVKIPTGIQGWPPHHSCAAKRIKKEK